jgi:tetratricopeptide (TPR) repeat protein
MERKKCSRCLILAGCFLCSFWMLTAQPGPKEQVYQAFVSDRMEAWDRVIVDLTNRKANLSDERLTELINYYYGYVGWAIGQGMDRKAKDYIQEAENLIDELLERHAGMPELFAYKGAFIGYRIGLNKIKAVVLGPESMRNINHAVDIGPDNPQGWIEKGNALFYMPKMFGGSKEKALEAYNMAIRLLEKDPAMTRHNWMYLNVLMILGQSYEHTGQLQKAKTTYEKVLQIEPAFTYMRDDVYPSFLKKWEAQR